jgi:PRMT5 oligomerisation domain
MLKGCFLIGVPLLCRDPAPDNSRECAVTFRCARPPATVHGFAGYFEAVLYDNVTLSTVPAAHTRGMHSWFPMLFPLKAPLRIEPGEDLTLAMWRVVRGTKARAPAAATSAQDWLFECSQHQLPQQLGLYTVTGVATRTCIRR